MAKQVIDDERFTSVRLPTSVKPRHYGLSLRPNFDEFTFSGQVRIDYSSSVITKSVVLNALELEILDGHIEATKSPLLAAVYSPGAEACTLEFQDDIPATGTIVLNFTGCLNDKLKGFYRTSFRVEDVTAYAATTQFEPNDARRCFPCWDEPSIKATFSVSIIISNKNLNINGRLYQRTAISNMPEVSRRLSASNPAELTIEFDKTPVMSTYLLAFIVGPLEMIETRNKGRPVRVYTTPGKCELGRFALNVATRSLTFYEEYFEIDYPLPKMDLVGVPDFSFGAMENWGLITYRENRIFVDPNNTATSLRQCVALVVAHEIAHQWFGNLVTMEWWTHLWLNEGFATFMEYQCIDALFPQYDIMSQFVVDAVLRALKLDAMSSSHPIEVPVRSPAQISGIFDEISYDKGASVIRMLCDYVGEDCFRQGLRDYLNKFAYKNAVTADLWDALERVSNKPVRKLMSGWTLKQGFPRLEVSLAPSSPGCTAPKLSISQSQFKADGKTIGPEEEAALWHVPISAMTGADTKRSRELPLIEGRSALVELGADATPGAWIKLNSGCMGLYRVAYSAELLDRLKPAVKDKSLPAMDRLGLLDDLFALSVTGVPGTVDFLKFLLDAYPDEDNFSVWHALDQAVSAVRALMLAANDSEWAARLRPGFNVYCQRLYAIIHGKLTWDAQQEELNEPQTRAVVIDRLLLSGQPGALAEAKRRFHEHVTGARPMAADLRGPVYKAIAAHGDDADFETLFKLHREAELSEEKNRLASALVAATGTARIERAIAYVMSDAVKIQDKPIALIALGSSDPVRAFQVLKDNFIFMSDKYGQSVLLQRLLRAMLQSFSSEERAREIETFFESHPVPGAERAISQAVESVRTNALWLAREQSSLESYLTSSEFV